MPAEVMCELHLVPNCRLCNRPTSADPHTTVLTGTAPLPNTPGTAIQNTSVPVHFTDKPAEPPKPELTDPKAKLALELAQAYEEVGNLQKLFDATKTALTEAIAKRDRVLAEMFPTIAQKP